MALVTPSTAPDPLVGVGAEVEDVASRRPPSRRAPARADLRRERSVFHPALVGLVALLPITILALLDSKRSLPSPPPPAIAAAHGGRIWKISTKISKSGNCSSKHSLECWAAKQAVILAGQASEGTEGRLLPDVFFGGGRERGRVVPERIRSVGRWSRRLKSLFCLPLSRTGIQASRSVGLPLPPPARPLMCPVLPPRLTMMLPITNPCSAHLLPTTDASS